MKPKPEILRTKFKGEIISEFLLPLKPSKKVAILCYGMPGVPKSKEVMEMLSKKGFWVFFPRYRGTWESGGEFLKDSAEKDILDMFEELSSGFKDLWTKKEYRISAPEVYLFGGSFGGPATILASSDFRVKKAVAICPVIDWQAPSDEPMDKLGPFIKEAFGEGYRFSMENWEKLSAGKFYSPKENVEKIDGSKLLLIHTKDDTTVPYKPTAEFAKVTGAKLLLVNKGGHTGFKFILDPKIWKKVSEFLKN